MWLSYHTYQVACFGQDSESQNKQEPELDLQMILERELFISL
jgi:hypothetical protein